MLSVVGRWNPSPPHLDAQSTGHPHRRGPKELAVAIDDENGAEPQNQSGKLGLSLEPVTPQIAKQLGLDSDSEGMVVTDVDQNGPAAEEGVARGDVILEINKKPVKSIADVESALKASADRPILLLITRRGQTIFLTVKPG